MGARSWAELLSIALGASLAHAEPPPPADTPRVPVICPSSDHCFAVVPDDAKQVELDLSERISKATAKLKLAGTDKGKDKPIAMCDGHPCAKVSVSDGWVLKGDAADVRIDKIDASTANRIFSVPADKLAFDNKASLGPAERPFPQIKLPQAAQPKESLPPVQFPPLGAKQTIGVQVVAPGPAVEVPPPPVLPRRSTAAPDDMAFGDVVLVGGHEYACTGVLVAPRLVLTAAHCLPATRVAFTSRADDPVLEITVADAQSHPELDAAVLMLATPSPWAPHPMRSTKAQPPSGEVRLIGFGLDEPRKSRGFGVKRRVPTLVHGWGCDRARERTTGCDPDNEMVIPAVSGSDTCNGDSGGPVFEQLGSSWRLVAITSRPTIVTASSCGRGGIYVRVDAIADWLAKYMGGAQ